MMGQRTAREAGVARPTGSTAALPRPSTLSARSTNRPTALREGPPYRRVLDALDRAATPKPWAADGQLYGVVRDGGYAALGFAPHRPADARLIVASRTGVPEFGRLIAAMERLVDRARRDPRYALAVAMRQAVAVFDASGPFLVSLHEHLAALDLITTPAPWEAGHLASGMSALGEPAQAGTLSPQPADAEMIAAYRGAVPRYLGLVASIQSDLREHATSGGCVSPEGADRVGARISAFDDWTVAAPLPFGLNITARA